MAAHDVLPSRAAWPASPAKEYEAPAGSVGGFSGHFLATSRSGPAKCVSVMVVTKAAVLGVVETQIFFFLSVRLKRLQTPSKNAQT